MATISQDDLLNNSGIFGQKRPTIQDAPIDENETDVPVWETTKAAFAQENVIGSALAKKAFLPEVPMFFESARPVDPDFNPFTDLEGYEQDAQKFTYLNSPEEVNQMKSFIDFQKDSRDILNRSGTLGTVSSMASGVIDPTILIPGTLAVKAGTMGAKIVKTAVSASALAAGAVGVQEGILQQTQTERDLERSVTNIVGAAVLGGILGTGLRFLTKADRAAARVEVENIAKGEELVTKVSDEGDVVVERSVGAAEVEKKATTLEDEGLARINEKVAAILSGPKKIQGFIIRGVRSEFKTVRKITSSFFEHNLIIGKNLKGETAGPALETLLKKDHGTIVRALRDVRNSYSDYVGVRKNLVGEEIRGAISSKFQGKMTYGQFNEEIARAMRRGDQHEIPQVAKAAQRLRKEIDDVTTKLQKEGILDETLEVSTARSYFTRRYNITKLSTPQGKRVFLNKLVTHFRKKNPTSSEAELLDDAERTLRNIKGLGDDRIQMGSMVDHFATSSKPRFTKDRVLDIADEEIEEFLVNDASEIFANYLSQANRMLRMQETLRRLEVDTVEDLRLSLSVEIDDIAKTSFEAGTKLENQLAEQKQLVDDMIDLFLGRPQGKSPGLRTLRNFNVLTLLGGVTISSLGDTMMPVFMHGATRVVRDGYAPMIRNLKTSKLSKDQLKDFAVGLELENNALLKSLVDPADNFMGIRSRFERFSDTAVQAFGKVSLLSHWNNFHKRLSGQVSLARTMRTLDQFKKTGKIDPDEVTRLATMGIGKDDYSRLIDQFNKFGERKDGSFISNSHLWDDDQAREILGSAVLKEVDATIVTPGKGDLPAGLHKSEVAKTVFQFKSFASAATNKILLSGLQRRDANVITGFIGLVGMGAFIGVLKDKIAGRDTKRTLPGHIREGLTRSGVLGLMADTAIFGLGPLGSGSSKYAGRNATSVLLGPTLGAIQDAAQSASNLKKGELTDADAKKLARFVPFQNVFYLRLLFEKAFGKPERNQ